MTIAVIKTGGKQYKVEAGDKIKVEKIESKSKTIDFDDILGGKKVKAEILESGKEDKIRVQKYKSKKRYKKIYGHKQPYTQIQIKEIK